MIHQPWGNVEGQETDIRIQAKELERIKQLTIDILVRHTGRSRDEIIADTERDFFLTAPDAVNYGIVDSVMQRRG
jgi:ATP-dependent Clp protease protease subunit